MQGSAGGIVNDYEAKQEARRARLERAADNARAGSLAAHKRSQDLVAGIPFGQPILVGHHSEKRHRNAVDKSWDALGRAVKLTDEAEEYDRRAASVGEGGISSDDPDAIEKLADKRTELEQKRDLMKAANAFYKKNGTLDGWDGPADIRASGESNLRHSWDKNHPFPSYALTNIGARIRQAAKRTEQIERAAAIPASVEEINGVRVGVDPLGNRVSLTFGARLSKDNYKRVRSGGFVWSPTRGAFVRKLSNGAVYNARELARIVGTPAQVPTNENPTPQTLIQEA